MAQSGRANSGLEAELLAMADYNSELSKATTRSTADERVIQAKANFMNMGLSQASNIQQGQNGMVTAMQNSMFDPTAGLASMGQGAKNLANTQSAIQMNYVKQLQGLMGYSAKNNVFGSTSSTAQPQTYAYSSSPISAADSKMLDLF